jgi:hypothetical protein
MNEGGPWIQRISLCGSPIREKRREGPCIRRMSVGALLGETGGRGLWIRRMSVGALLGETGGRGLWIQKISVCGSPISGNRREGALDTENLCLWEPY